MEMIKITHHNDPAALTIPQYMLGLHVTCWLAEQYKPEAEKLTQALNRDDRDSAREILNRHGYEIDFYEIEDDEQWNR